MAKRDELQMRRAVLSGTKQALLEKRLRWDEKSHTTTQTIPKRPAEALVPLSFAQQRLWFLDQLDGHSGAYNISLAVRLLGRLNREHLQRSLDILVQRHESLRTVFVEEQESPIQQINPAEQVALPYIDLQFFAQEQRTLQLQTILTQESLRPFQLEKGPLLRTALIQLAGEEHILLVCMHHIITDGWSQSIFFRELSSIYSALLAEKPLSLLDLPIQYADFALWQRSFQSKTLEDEEAYWRQQLAGVQPLELPTDYIRPARRNFKGARQTLLLSKDLSTHLKLLSQQSETTLFMVLLAAFQIMLSRYSGQSDIAVGTSIANRTYEELEGVIGCFANTLVLRADLSGEPTYLNLLEQVKRVALEAYAHQNLSLEKVVEILQPERDLSRSPLFQVMFILQNMPAVLPMMTGLVVQPLDHETVTTKFDLTLSVANTPDGLLCDMEYDVELFMEQKIQRMFKHWQTILEEVVKNPDQRISAIALLSPEERRQQLYTWNATQAAFPRDACIHELFSLQASQTPDAIAIYTENQALSYAVLHLRVQRLASYLRQQGVRSGVLVGLCLERSAEMLVAMLGILGAGGAYIPLDPSYPRDRIQFMLADSQAPLLLTEERFCQFFSHFTGQIVCLPLPAKNQLEATQELDLSYQNMPLQPAYVIYTSGSTGRPKGTMITHRSVVNFLVSMSQRPGITSQDCILAITSISFDISVLEVLLPLVIGASVHLVSREVAADGEALLTLLDQSRSTIMQATPASWRLLLAAGWNGEHPLKAFCGGEELSLAMARNIRMRTSELWNMYGPTETTIWSMIEQVTDAPDSVTIGRPIANTQVYLLDQFMQPIPISVSGELYIGGDGLAYGYLSRPDLTAERFVPDPFHPQVGQRLYRTGDLARYRADGRIEYLGRIDHQVKLRGFRIELGEIEACLQEHPAIRQCVALVREDRSQERYLVAYLQAASSQQLSLQELRAYLSKTLPSYMIPSHFLWMEVFPLTPNGKIDRKALPLPTDIGPLASKNWVAPRTPLEEELSQIWADILGIERIGVEDNFFELGGHSLLSIRLITQIRRAFQIDLPLVALFDAPTVAELALLIEDLFLTEIEQLDEGEIPQTADDPAQ